MRAPSLALSSRSQASPLRCANTVGARRSEGVSPIILISLRRALPLVIRVQPPKRSLRSSHLRQSTKESSRGWAEKGGPHGRRRLEGLDRLRLLPRTSENNPSTHFGE